MPENINIKSLFYNDKSSYNKYIEFDTYSNILFNIFWYISVMFNAPLTVKGMLFFRNFKYSQNFKILYLKYLHSEIAIIDFRESYNLFFFWIKHLDLKVLLKVYLNSWLECAISIDLIFRINQHADLQKYTGDLLYRNGLREVANSARIKSKLCSSCYFVLKKKLTTDLNHYAYTICDICIWNPTQQLLAF